MNVYDFDGTIYRGDSTVDFYRFCLKSDPTLLRFLPRQIFGFLRYFTNRIDKSGLKEIFFCFLDGIVDPEKTVEDFWKKNSQKIQSWYLGRAASTDVAISASPYFLLKPICDELDIAGLIASNVDIKSGRFLGKNCYGCEKVVRFAEEYDAGSIDEFYSDSRSDQPLANLARNAYFVKKGSVRPW